MAYGEYIRCTFDNAAGTECIISIYRDGYADAYIEATGGPNPIVIKMMADGDEKYTPIKATEAYIELVSTTNFQFLPLFTGTNKQHKVVFTVGGEVKWVGWINPELYIEPFDYPPYIVTIHAVDGLAELRNVEYTLPVDTVDYDEFHRTLHEFIILNILYNIGTEIGYEVAVNLQYLTGSSPVYERILEKIYIDYRAFRNEDGTFWNCYAILETLLKSLTAQVRISDGKWRIDCIDQKYQTFRCDVYTGGGSYDSTINAQDDREALTAWNASPMLRFESGATLEVEPAYKEFTIRQTYGNRTNLLKFNNYEGNFYADEFVDSDYDDLNYWELLNGAAVTYESDWEAVRIKEFATGAGVPSKYLSSDAVPLGVMTGATTVYADSGEFITAWTNDDIRLHFSFDYYSKKLARTNAESVQCRVRLYFYFDSATYTYGDNGTGTFEWKLIADGFMDSIIEAYPNEWNSFDFIIPRPPDAIVGTDPAEMQFRVLLYQGWSNTGAGSNDDGMCFKAVRLWAETMTNADTKDDFRVNDKYRLWPSKKNKIRRVVPFFIKEADDYEREISTTISANNINTANDYEVNFGEIPLEYGAVTNQQVYQRYSFFDASGNYIRYYANYPGSVVIQDLVNSIIKTKLQNTYSYPTFRLRGRIHDRGSLMTFASVIKDYSSRHYFINAVEWNAKEMTWDGEFVQFYPYTIGGDFLDTDFNIDFFIE